MEKKKRIVSKLIFALVIAVIVSMCFVGTTLARYASGSNGSSSTKIATWKVTITTDGTNATDTKTIELGMLSPAEEAYSEGSVRSHSTGRTKVAQIVIENDVEADLTITAGAIEATGSGFDDGNTYAEGDVDGAPSKAQVESLFSVKLYINEDADKADSATEYTSATLKTLATGTHTIYVYAEATWTSADESLKGDADALDTWIGANVTSFGFDLTYSAVQGSEAPATT